MVSAYLPKRKLQPPPCNFLLHDSPFEGSWIYSAIPIPKVEYFTPGVIFKIFVKTV
jgi:hypothetical protein